jgi:hypothetical protein
MKQYPLYLFGSGTSPLPKVSELTTCVLEADLHRHRDVIGFRTSDSSKNRKPPYSAKHNPEFIRRLLALIRLDIAIYQERDLHDVSYEDIADVCVHLKPNEATHRNPALQPYREKLCETLCTHFPKSKDQIAKEFGDLVGATVEWIQWAIYHEFTRCQKTPDCAPNALTKFHASILRHTPQATIVTLNHDTLLEKVLGDNINLGFATDASGENLFTPDTLAGNQGDFKILKLHGSIDWFYSKKTGDWKIIREASIDKFNPYETPLIISGTIGKLESYNFGISQWLWADFQNTLRATRRIIISGYGFKDLGINVRLQEWLKHYPDARLVIIHPSPSELIASLDKRYFGGGVKNYLPSDPQIISDFSSPFALPEKQISFIAAPFEEASSPEIAAWLNAFAQSQSPA